MAVYDAFRTDGQKISQQVSDRAVAEFSAAAFYLIGNYSADCAEKYACILWETVI